MGEAVADIGVLPARIDSVEQAAGLRLRLNVTVPARVRVSVMFPNALRRCPKGCGRPPLLSSHNGCQKVGLSIQHR